MSDSITYDEFWKAFQTWDEQTSTSPSGRHLGHYKSLLISDGNDAMYDEDNPNPSCAIKRVYYHMAMATLYSANTLTRWCRSSTMMLEKTPGQPRINKLRVIHLYEADYNLLLKILWARRLVWHSHQHDHLHEAQAGSRPQHRCSDVVLRKEMNYQYSKFTRTDLATVDNDAKACYDWIVCNLAMIISQHFGMTNRACKMHSKTLQAMLFTIRTSGGDSTTSYRHTENTPIHGSGQGSCASPSLWLHISTLLLKLLDDIAQGMTRHDVIENHKRRISAEGFVDDISLFINHTLLPDENLTRLYEFIHHDINAWQQLLASSGGKLELTKCFYYVLSWKFNKFGDPLPKSIDEIYQEVSGCVQITDPDTMQVITMHQLDVSQVHKTLGVLKSISGDDNEQIQSLLAKSDKLAAQTRSGQLTRYQARRAYTAIYMPAMTYSLVATSISESSLHNIQSKALRAFLPAMGYEPTFPRAIVHGPRKFGGLNIGHLYTEMQVAKIGSLIAHIQAQSGLGDIMLKNINWLQLHSGLLTPVLQYQHPISYIPYNWFLHVKEFLYSIRGKIIIPGQWVPKLERVYDQAIMEAVVCNDSMTNAECRIFNNWRVYFQASTLSDIVDPDGIKIQSTYWTIQGEHDVPKGIRRSRHNWPRQQRPHPSTFRIWRKGLRTFCGNKLGGELSRPLEDWEATFRTSSNEWMEYLDPTTRIVYIRQSDKTFWAFLPIKVNVNRTIYSAVPDDFMPDIPNHCIPVQTLPINSSIMQVTHRNFCGPIPQRNDPVHTFEDHLTTLPKWRSDLLLHWSTILLPDLQAIFSNTAVLRIASDGSYNQATHYGAFGAVIGTDEHILMQVRGHAPGHSELKSSFRSELYGVLAALVLLHEVSSYCGLSSSHQQTVITYVDSKSVVDRLHRHRGNNLHLGEMLSADIDVELQILDEIRLLEHKGFRVAPIQHVKAHQDDDKCYEELSREAQLNVEADALASSMSQQSYYNIPYSMFPTTKIQLQLDDQAITSKYKECLRTAYLTQDMHDYYQQKFEWESSVLDDIWWDAFGTAVNRLSHADRQKIQKFDVRRLHTNYRKHMVQPSSSEFCTHCTTEIETNDHILQCKNCAADRMQAKEEWKQKLFDYLSEDHTPDMVKHAIMAAVHCWLNDSPIPPIQLIAPTATPELVTAYQSQSHIGWDNFFKGKLSIYWSNIVTEHLKRAGISPRTMTSDRWASQLVSELWLGVLAIWDYRNKEVYGHDHVTHNTKLKEHLLQEVTHILSKLDTPLLSTVPWLQKPMAELEQYSVIGLKAWIRNARTIVRLYYKEQQVPRHDIHSSHDNDMVERLQRTHIDDQQIPMDRQGETILVGRS